MSGYTSVDNDIFDAGLSYRAIGLLLTMLSKPPGWRFASTRLAADAKEGRQAVRTAMNELIEAGFVGRSVSKIDNHLVTRHLLRDSKRTPMMETTGDQEPDASNLDALVRPLGLNRPKALPKTTPEEQSTGLRPGISTEKEPDMPDMEFGGGGTPGKKSGPHSERKPSGLVINHMIAVWPIVVTAWPSYRNYKVVDIGGNRPGQASGFAKYLNDNFFGPEAKTPMTVAEVNGMVDRFLADLRDGGFSLKENQPVWQAFARRWQNYPPEQQVSQDDDQTTVVKYKGDTSDN